MNYEQALEWMYALEARAGMDFRLERFRCVLQALKDPQRAFPAIHVVGTNGKGSTAAMLHSIYHRAGVRVGLYTSPHLVSFCERIRVGDRMISRESVIEKLEIVRAGSRRASVSLTFFEIVTAMAFLEFREASVDLAVVEAGLGGRLDATNVLRTIAVALTSIGKDHERFLGDSLEDIAGEKVAVVASGVTLVSGPLPAPALRVVRQHVATSDSDWRHYGRDFGPVDAAGCGFGSAGLLGEHQRRNAAVARTVVEVVGDRFPISDEQIASGIGATRWPGRLEMFGSRPLLLVDGAHNPQAVDCLREALPELVGDRPVVLLFGVLEDKDWREMLCRLLPVCDHVVLAPIADNRRALDPRRVRPWIGGRRPGSGAAAAAGGLREAGEIAGPAGAGLITGSVFLVGGV